MKIKKKKAPKFFKGRVPAIYLQINFFVDDDRTLKILADL